MTYPCCGSSAATGAWASAPGGGFWSMHVPFLRRPRPGAERLYRRWSAYNSASPLDIPVSSLMSFSMLLRAPACLARPLRAVLPVVCVALLLGACGRDNDDAAKKKAAAAAPQAIPVTVRQVQPQ